MEKTRHDPALNAFKCATLLVGGTEVGTPRELANLLGTADTLVWNHHESHMDWCLCAIDLAKSLKIHGMTLRDDDGKLIIERTTHHHV